MNQPTRRHLLLAAAACASGLHRLEASAQTGPNLSESEKNQIEAIARQWMSTHKVPGLQVAFAKQGQLVLRQSFGLASLETREPLNNNHLMRIASISKPITAATIFVLAEKGLLKLSDPVFSPGGHLKPNITAAKLKPLLSMNLHHLLTHTGAAWGGSINDPMFQVPGMPQAQLIDEVLNAFPMQEAPGSRHEYTNFGYCLLGRVIERVTGMTYAQAVEQALLSKCGISSMKLASATPAANEVSYLGQNGENPHGFNIARMDSHGGWLSSASDLVRFAVHVDGGDSPRDVLSKASLKTMTTPTSASPDYASGWSVNRGQNYWHAGSLPGTSAMLVRTASGLCWAALANSRTQSSLGAMDEMMWKIARAVRAWEA
jgi:CubicO group peptidase (beta-lactamase class C family)